MTSPRLQGKNAIITGAGSGIGAQIALAFAKEGARVCVADVNAYSADAVAQEIRSVGGTAIGIRMDVALPEEVASAVELVASTLGGIDVLVSNAGIQHLQEIGEVSFENWKRVLAVHLDGAFLTTRECLKYMYAQGGGTVILMGSVHSKEASPLKGPYVVAKHGLLGLCRVIAKEGARYGVRANVICPGFVKTPLVERQIPLLAQRLGISENDVIQEIFLKSTVDGEFTTESDIAEVALFLASFPSNALTGQSIVVSHGWHMA